MPVHTLIGQNGWNVPPEMLGKYSPTRDRVTFREIGELRICLMPMVPDELILKILGPEQ
jgi:hypothetical protein